ncbi:liver-expressed antimicrobial peptide 2 [Amia ocellicauda]|uniref:liver-expressed antimicrobial peptide 2 n=1 Tax=Amia ocellicauda TaxID=2972642 RepID=UPI0034648C14
MRQVLCKVLAVAVLMSLICNVQVRAAPLKEGVLESAMEVVHRAKRSLFWRWNMLRPVGYSCREHFECATNYCK